MFNVSSRLERCRQFDGRVPIADAAASEGLGCPSAVSGVAKGLGDVLQHNDALYCSTQFLTALL